MRTFSTVRLCDGADVHMCTCAASGQEGRSGLTREIMAGADALWPDMSGKPTPLGKTERARLVIMIGLGRPRLPTKPVGTSPRPSERDDERRGLLPPRGYWQERARQAEGRGGRRLSDSVQNGTFALGWGWYRLL
jgi:hypothetical protein